MKKKILNKSKEYGGHEIGVTSFRSVTGGLNFMFIEFCFLLHSCIVVYFNLDTEEC